MSLWIERLCLLSLIADIPLPDSCAKRQSVAEEDDSSVEV